MGKLEGKVAFITGAARGQGRSHAIRLAQEGADIIAVDICEQIATVGYPMSTPDDLAETAKQVEALDRRIFAAQADVRDAGRAEGRPSTRARPSSARSTSSSPTRASPRCPCTRRREEWQDVIDVNLTGVYNTVEAAIPSMIERGAGRRDRAHQLHGGDQRHRRRRPRAGSVTPRPSTAWSA